MAQPYKRGYIFAFVMFLWKYKYAFIQKPLEKKKTDLSLSAKRFLSSLSYCIVLAFVQFLALFFFFCHLYSKNKNKSFFFSGLVKEAHEKVYKVFCGVNIKYTSSTKETHTERTQCNMKCSYLTGTISHVPILNIKIFSHTRNTCCTSPSCL